MSEIRGLILAGGSGSRLWPATKVTNKHLLTVFDKPMIYYSISNLFLCGIRDIGIVCRPQDKIVFQSLLGNGSQFGVAFSYLEQHQSEGIPHAINSALEFSAGDKVLVCLGDNIFFGSGLGRIFEGMAALKAGAHVLLREVPDPQRFGVLVKSSEGLPKKVIEKPIEPESNLAVTGLYFFDQSLADKFIGLSKSARGEFEVADLLNIYIAESSLTYTTLPRGTMWLDVGTMDSLFDASNFVRNTQFHTGQIIGSPEEIAWRNGWISEHEFLALIESSASPYYKMLRDAYAFSSSKS
jgi:glucose-1-phosphate thymidylyltransferase